MCTCTCSVGCVACTVMQIFYANFCALRELEKCFSFFHRLYIEEKIGTKYIEKKTIAFEASYQESGPATPVFFVLSPGVDPLKDVEALGKTIGFSLDNRNLHNVSLGQVCKYFYL